jgi:hypothetical protein
MRAVTTAVGKADMGSSSPSAARGRTSDSSLSPLGSRCLCRFCRFLSFNVNNDIDSLLGLNDFTSDRKPTIINWIYIRITHTGIS